MYKCSVICICITFIFVFEYILLFFNNNIAINWCTLSSHPHRHYSTIKETRHHHFIFFTLKAHLSQCSSLHFLGIRIEVSSETHSLMFVFSSLGVSMKYFAFDLKFSSIRQHTNVTCILLWASESLHLYSSTQL